MACATGTVPPAISGYPSESLTELHAQPADYLAALLPLSAKARQIIGRSRAATVGSSLLLHPAVAPGLHPAARHHRPDHRGAAGQGHRGGLRGRGDRASFPKLRLFKITEFVPARSYSLCSGWLMDPV